MLFAKIKGTRGNPSQHRIMASGERSLRQFGFYIYPNILHAVAFNPDRKLESDEWFYVELTNDQKEKMLDAYLINENSSVDLNKAVESDYGVIEVVYRVDEPRAIFTKVTESYRVRNKTLLKFHDLEQVEVIQESNSIEFNGDVHAYYDGNLKLYFRKFDKVRSMFPGIEEFYRKATEDEKQRFVDSGIFVNNGVDVNTIGQRDSRRIAMVLTDEAIGFNDAARYPNIIQAARNTAELLDLEITDDNRVVLEDKMDVTKILKVLLSRYYISDITGRRMEAYASAAIDN